MEEEKGNIPLEVRSYVVAQSQIGVKQREIVDLVQDKFNRKIAQGTISKIISKYNDEGNCLDRPRSGRPKKQSEKQELAMINAVENDRTLNATIISKDPILNPCGLTARRITSTLNDHGLFDSTAIVEAISPDIKEERLNFALDFLEKKRDWSFCIFSDESDLFPDKAGKYHYRRYEGERVELDLGPTYRWDPRRVKVWGSISYDGVGTLIRYSENMKATDFIKILEENLLKDYPLLRGTRTRQGKYYFQLDNAPVHRALDVQKFFCNNHITTLIWPSYSPDLNPIENVWAFIKERLFKKNSQLTSADQTWEEIQRIWYFEVNSIIKNLYDSMPNRLQTVIELEGGRISC